jgi:hypothetical protein
VTTVTETTRYGTAVAQSWDRLHPRLTSRAAWEHHDGELPVIEGTLIRLAVDHLSGDRDPKPGWLWWSRTGAGASDADRLWQAFLRRFDLEHTACSSRPSAGPPRKSATRRPPTGGPGWSSQPAPSSASPARSPPACAVPGNGPAHRDG